MPTSNLRFLLFASVWLAPFAARGQLATVSPFMAPAGAGASATTADAPLEFRGVAEMPDGPAFRVVDPARRRGAWVKLNERDTELGVMVKQHDPERETVTVEQQGRTFTLALHQSKVSSSGAAIMTTARMTPPPQMQVPTIAAMNVPPPAAPLQQAQLDAVTAAVAQRRALREQAAQQINQGMRMAPQVVQPPQPQRAQNAPAQNQNGRNGQNNNPRRDR